MKIIIVLIAFQLMNPAWSQLQQFKNEFGKIGMKNYQNEVVVPCLFDEIQYTNKFKISESQLIVKADGKYGLFSQIGKILLPTEFDEVYVSNNALGYIGFAKHGKHGIYDTNLEQIRLEPTYDSKIIFSMNNQFADVELKKKVGVINDQLTLFIPAVHEDFFPTYVNLLCLKKNGYFGFYDYKGILVVPFEYEDVGFINTKTQRIPLKRNGRWGVLDFSGKTIVNFDYDSFGGYFSGLSAVSKNGKFGYIDEKGKLVIPLQFDEADYFNDKVAFVGQIQAGETMKYALINKKGKTITDFKYDYYEDYFYEGYSLVSKAGKWGVINEKGEEIIPLLYKNEDIDPEFETIDQTYIKIKEGNTVQLFNSLGAPQLVNGFDSVEYVEMDSNLKVVQVFKNGLTGLVELGTRKIIIPCEYSEIHLYDFEYGQFVKVVYYDSVGVWDLRLGKLIVPAIFEVVYEQEVYTKTEIQFFQVSKDGKFGVWDATNYKMVVPTEFKIVEFFDEAVSSKLFFFIGRIGESWGLFDQSGKCVIPWENTAFELRFVLKTNNMFYFILTDMSSQKTGIYNALGKVVLPFNYDEVNGIEDGKAFVQIDDESLVVPLLKD